MEWVPKIIVLFNPALSVGVMFIPTFLSGKLTIAVLCMGLFSVVLSAEPERFYVEEEQPCITVGDQGELIYRADPAQRWFLESRPAAPDARRPGCVSPLPRSSESHAEAPCSLRTRVSGEECPRLVIQRIAGAL